MRITRRDYANETYLTQTASWGLFTGGKVLCADGISRTLKRIAQNPDTLFYIPAAVSVRGKTVAGYVSVETLGGFSKETPGDPTVAKFVAVTNKKNAGLLPGGAFRKGLF